jgi:hypothetical protein
VSVDVTRSSETVTVSLPTSKVNELVDSATDNKASIDVSTVRGVTDAQMTSTALTRLADEGLDLEVKLPQGTITLDNGALSSLIEQAGADVTISLDLAGVSDLTPAQRSAVRGSDLIFDITISSGTQKITNFDGSLTITVPYRGPLPAAAWYLNDDGELERLESTYDPATRTVTFTTSHLSFYVIGHDEEAETAAMPDTLDTETDGSPEAGGAQVITEAPETAQSPITPEPITPAQANASGGGNASRWIIIALLGATGLTAAGIAITLGIKRRKAT